MQERAEKSVKGKTQKGTIERMKLWAIERRNTRHTSKKEVTGANKFFEELFVFIGEFVITQRMRETNKDLPSTGSLPKCPKWLELSQPKPGDRSFLQVSQ